MVVHWVLSQTLDEDERNYHLLLSTQPKHRTALLAFGTQSRQFLVVPCESEDVSELLMCYLLWVSERNRTAGEIASNDDYASSALSLLPRHGYCATWHHARREATVSVPGLPGSRADISPGVRVRRAIAWGQATDC